MSIDLDLSLSDLDSAPRRVPIAAPIFRVPESKPLKRSQPSISATTSGSGTAKRVRLGLAQSQPLKRQQAPSSSGSETAKRTRLAAPIPVTAPPAPRREKRRQPGMLSMETFMVDLLRADLKQEQDKARQKRVHKKWEYDMLRDLSKLECEGDRNVRLMLAALDYLDKTTFPRSKQQKMIHRAMLLLSLEQYYGDDLQAHLVRLLEQYKVSELRTEGLFTAPRRFGKTVSISMFAACEIVVLSGDSTNELGHDVLVYSNNQRASSLMLLHTYRLVKVLCANPRFGGAVLHLNKKEKMIFRTKEGWVNEMSAFPANEEKLRGTGSKALTSTVIGEEIGFMPVQIVFKILAPILVRRKTKFIGITTINTADSFLMPLAEAKFPDGRSIMLSLNFDLVCDECKRKGRALQCKCLMADIPHWQSATRHDKMQYLMAGQMETFLTEIKNVPIDELVSPAFCRSAVDWLRSDEAVIRQSEIYATEIYTAVDPACGGRYSKYAIVSAIFRDSKFIIVGIDSCKSNRPEEQSERLVQHIRTVRSLRGLESARVIFCPESNLAHEGKRIAQDLARERVENVYCLHEDVSGNEGVRTTETLKKEMVISFNALLLQHRVRFHPKMVCISNGDLERFTPESIRKMQIDEIAAYQRELRPNRTNPNAPPKELYSGKLSGCDDHCIAVQLCYKAIEFWAANSDFYSKLRPLYDKSKYLVGS